MIPFTMLLFPEFTQKLKPFSVFSVVIFPLMFLLLLLAVVVAVNGVLNDQI